MEWDLDPRKPKQVVDAITFKARDDHPHYMYIADVHGPRMSRIMQLAEAVFDFLCRTKPDAVIVESPFMSKSPNAFGALTECVFAVRMAVMRYNPYLPFTVVDPTTAKKNAGVVFKKLPKGTKRDNKADIYAALGKRTDLVYCMSRESLDEHATDSSAVGLYYFDQVI